MRKKIYKFKALNFMLIFAFLFNIISYVPVKALEQDKAALISQSINSTKAQIKNLSRYQYTDLLALNGLNENINQEKINIYSYKKLSTYSNNVISLICSGKNPYDHNGVNYVKHIIDSQKSDGTFILGNEFEDLNTESLAKAIIALDMAKAEYNTNAAIKALMNYASNKENVRDTALAIIALSSHRDIGGVNASLENLKKYLKEEQCFDGSFPNNSLSEDSLDSEGNVLSTSMAIEALLALNEDPLSSQWKKDGKDLLDALLTFKKEDKFIYNASYKSLASTDCTSFAVTALLDLKSGASSYKTIKFEKEKPVASISISAEATSVKVGKELKLEGKALDKDNKLIQGKDFSWSLSNNAKANIKENGVLQAKEPGKITVFAELKDDSSKKSSIDIEIYAPVPNSMEIVNQESSIKVGQSLLLKALVKDKDGEEILALDKAWSVSDASLGSIDKDGLLKGYKEGNLKVTCHLSSNKNISSTKDFEVKKASSLDDIKPEDKEKIKNRIEELKEFYKTETVEALAPLALNKVNADKATLDKTYVKRGSSALIYSQNIIALTGANKNPRDYKDRNFKDGIDFVKELSTSQKPEGDENEGKFIVGKYMDPKSAVALSYSIISLELAKGNYNKELAIKALMNMINNNKFEEATYDIVETKALALIALAANPEIEGVDKTISTLISDIKTLQQKDASFDCRNKPRAMSMVIQALIANDINPLSEEWTQDNNLLDSLLKYKASPRMGSKVAGFSKTEGGSYDLNTTYHGIAALADLYNSESIFGIKNSIKDKIKNPPIITIEGVGNDLIYKDSVNVKISTDTGAWTATLNGESFLGGQINKAGKYTLKVVADFEGVKSSKEINFILDMAPYEDIKLRVEGNKKTLFNGVISSSQADSNALDLLKKAVGKDNIKGTGAEGEGYFISEILGETQSKNFGWSYCVKKGNEISQPMVSADLFKDIKDADGKFNYDELIFYMTHYEFDGEFKLYTHLPSISLRSLEENHELTVKSSSDNKALKEVFVNVQGIGNFKTDADGKVTFNAPKGIYNISVVKRSDFIEVVPNSYSISLPVKEEILSTEYDENKINKALEDPFINNILVEMKDITKVSSNIFKNALGKNKTLKFITPMVQWEFNGKDIVVDNLKDIDLSVKNDSKNKNDILSKFSDATVLSFADNGVLPGKAKITLNYSEKSPVYLYYYNEATKNIEKISGPHIGKDDHIDFEIKHCSDYFLSSIDIDKARTEKLEDVIRDISSYYMKKDIYGFRPALALSHISKDMGDLGELMGLARPLKDKLHVKEIEKVTDCVNDIILLISAGENPKNYQGKNYVKALVEAQKDTGAFIIQDGDQDWPTIQAFAILALDMSKANYNKEQAVKYLLSLSKDGCYSDIDTTAMVITALSTHKDIDDVSELINSSIESINKAQLPSGGFEAWDEENPYSLAAVIQALIANDQNIFDSKWVKNGTTLVDALLKFKNGDHFEYTSKWGTEISMVTEQAFLALADIYKGKSAYQSIVLSGEESESNETALPKNDTEKDDNQNNNGNINSSNDNDNANNVLVNSGNNAIADNSINDNIAKDNQSKTNSSNDAKELVKTGTLVNTFNLCIFAMLLIILGYFLLSNKVKESNNAKKSSI